MESHHAPKSVGAGVLRQRRAAQQERKDQLAAESACPTKAQAPAHQHGDLSDFSIACFHDYRPLLPPCPAAPAAGLVTNTTRLAATRGAGGLRQRRAAQQERKDQLAAESACPTKAQAPAHQHGDLSDFSIACFHDYRPLLPPCPAAPAAGLVTNTTRLAA